MHLLADTTALSPSPPLQSTSTRPASTTSVHQSSSPDGKRPENPHSLDQKISDLVELSGQDPDLAELKTRDREVRAHEAAHSAAAGSLTTGGPQFTYQRGTDGRLYAVGGEVNIDTSAVAGDPQATIQKAQRIRAAALAPANPSAQDRSVATQATRLEAQARQEMQQERTDRIQDATSSKFTPTNPAPQLLDLFV